jgi:hypothetical protein
MDTIELITAKIQRIKKTDPEISKNFPKLSATINRIIFFPDNGDKNDLRDLIHKVLNQVICYDIATTGRKDIIIFKAKNIITDKSGLLNRFPGLKNAAEKIVTYEGKDIKREKEAYCFYKLKLDFDWGLKTLEKAKILNKEIELALSIKYDPRLKKLPKKERDDLLKKIEALANCQNQIEEKTIPSIEKRIEELNKLFLINQLPLLEDWAKKTN